MAMIGRLQTFLDSNVTLDMRRVYTIAYIDASGCESQMKVLHMTAAHIYSLRCPLCLPLLQCTTYANIPR